MASSPKEETPSNLSGEDEVSKAEHVKTEVPRPLQSWLGDDPQPMGSAEEDWEGPSLQPQPSSTKNHRLGNWLFALALAGVAVGAGLVVTRVAAYNRSRGEHKQLHPSVAVAINLPGGDGPAAAIRDGDRPERDHPERDRPEVRPVLIQPAPTEESRRAAAQGDPVDDNASATPESIHASDAGQDSEGGPLEERAAAAHRKSLPPKGGRVNTEIETTNASPPPPLPAKLPIRTPEGAAALAKIRELQARRRSLYDRAIVRGEGLRETSTSPVIDETNGKGQAQAMGRSTQNSDVDASPDQLAWQSEDFVDKSTKENKGKSDDSLPRGAKPEVQSAAKPCQDDDGVAFSSTSAHKDAEMQTKTDDISYARWVAQQVIEQEDANNAVEPVEIPEGMSIEAVRDRAMAANKAAASAVEAAYRAASASALAAEAADDASHAAQNAMEAASRCQGALDLASADAVEAAYKAAVEAEETASSAARRAAAASAGALVGRHDAERRSLVASRAADLSAPHGIVENFVDVMRQGRRKVGAAVHGLEEGIASAGPATQQAAARVAENGRRAFGKSRQAVTGAFSHLQEKYFKRSK